MTVPELNLCRDLCNFTSAERDLFELKAKDKTNVEIALTMNISEAQVSKLTRRVINKVVKVM